MVVTDRIVFRIRRDETTGFVHRRLTSVSDIVVYASGGNALRRVPIRVFNGQGSLGYAHLSGVVRSDLQNLIRSRLHL